MVNFVYYFLYLYGGNKQKEDIINTYDFLYKKSASYISKVVLIYRELEFIFFNLLKLASNCICMMQLSILNMSGNIKVSVEWKMFSTVIWSCRSFWRGVSHMIHSQCYEETLHIGLIIEQSRCMSFWWNLYDAIIKW